MTDKKEDLQSLEEALSLEDSVDISLFAESIRDRLPDLAKLFAAWGAAEKKADDSYYDMQYADADDEEEYEAFEVAHSADIDAKDEAWCECKKYIEKMQAEALTA